MNPPSRRANSTHRLRSSSIARSLLMLGCIIFTAAHLILPHAMAQQDAPPADPRDPILNDDALLEGRITQSWRQGNVRWLLLRQDVRFAIGTQGFRGDAALVRIEQERIDGRTVRHLAVYLDNARPAGRHRRVEAEAPRLLVTVSTRGRVELATDLLTPLPQPADDPFTRDGEQRIARYLATQREQPAEPGPQLVGVGSEAQRETEAQRIEQTRQELQQRTHRLPGVAPQPRAVRDAPPDAPPPAPPPAAPIDLAPAPTVRPAVAPSDLEDQQILPARGRVSFAYDRIESEPLDDETRYIALIGNVQVMYQDFDSGRTMTLTADNAVIFVAVGRTEDLLDGRSLDAQSVLGIYLEDNVIISDGLYTLRAPRVYIDPEQNRAMVLEAVVYTVDIRRQIPLYIRADRLRQESRTNWSGENVTLTTSEFAEPHFAIRSGRLSFDQTPDPQTRQVRQRYESRDNVFNVGPLSVFYWPKLAGDVTDTPPIERINVGMRRRGGRSQPDVQTRWNLFALAGYDAPPGVALSGDIDYRGDHNLGLGLDLRYDVPDMFGRTRGYILPYDTGLDRIGQRRDVEFDGETRGFVQLEHRHYLPHDLELSLQLGYVSDPTLLEEFFWEEAYTGRPYETSVYLKQQRNDRAFTLLAKYDVNNFLPQLSELQAPGYFVEKMPELGYRQIGTSLFGDRLTYFTENRLSRMRIVAGRDSPSDRGFGPMASAMFFGITPATTFEEAAAMRGLPDDYRLRLDTRHELQAPFRLGAISVVPYAAGRVTAYDDDFAEYRGEDENVRLWGTVGARLHTQFSRDYNDVSSRFFDLHRLRHIIEPNANVFLIATNIDAENLPVYDPDVEALQKGFGARIGMRHTFQTQRGGEGNWRGVDWLVINTDYVYRSNDADIRADVARFFDYRPEYSVGGEHLQGDLRWMVTDTFALVGDVTWSLEHHNVPLWHIGANIDHTPRFSTSIEYAEIDIIDSQLITWGARYRMTPKYNLAYRQRWNLGENETQDMTLILERRLPQWRLQILYRHDAIDDEHTFGVALIPELFSGGNLIFGP